VAGLLSGGEHRCELPGKDIVAMVWSCWDKRTGATAADGDDGEGGNPSLDGEAGGGGIAVCGEGGGEGGKGKEDGV
jgi:hypothetical protein